MNIIILSLNEVNEIVTLESLILFHNCRSILSECSIKILFYYMTASYGK